MCKQFNRSQSVRSILFWTVLRLSSSQWRSYALRTIAYLICIQCCAYTLIPYYSSNHFSERRDFIPGLQVIRHIQVQHSRKHSRFYFVCKLLWHLRLWCNAIQNFIQYSHAQYSLPKCILLGKNRMNLCIQTECVLTLIGSNWFWWFISGVWSRTKTGICLINVPHTVLLYFNVFCLL